MSTRQKTAINTNNSLFKDNGYEEIDHLDRAGYVTHYGELFFGQADKLPKGYESPSFIRDNDMKPDFIDDIQKHVKHMLKQEELMAKEYDRAVAAEYGIRSPKSTRVDSTRAPPKQRTARSSNIGIKTDVPSNNTRYTHKNSAMNNTNTQNVIVSVKTKNTSSAAPKTNTIVSRLPNKYGNRNKHTHNS